MAVDLNEQLIGQLAVIGNQGVANNQTFAAYLPYAALQELHTGGQADTPAILAGMNAADRTPVIKQG